MAEFPSEEWLTDYARRIDESPRYREAAATWEGDVSYVFEAEPDKGVPEEIWVWLDLWHGRCRASRYGLSEEEGQKARFIIRAPYTRWKEVINRQLDPIKGMMQGKLKLKGDLPTIVRYVKAANELVNLAASVPTEFVDEKGTNPEGGIRLRALVFDDIEALSVREVPDARVEAPGDAVVRVTATAICGSDLHFYHGKAPLSPGDTLGHEAVGVVEETGPDVERFHRGDRVVVAFNIVCGSCWFCLHQENALCEEFRNLGAGPFGGDLGGCQAELVRVPYADTNLLALPSEIEDERALFVGDALTTGYYGAAIAGIRPGDTVAVVGAGPVGFFCIQAAMAFDPEIVLAIDLEPDRLSLAEKMGAVAVNPRERSPQMAVSERTGGRGADVVIEAVGTPAAYETAIDVVRRGGAVSVLGMFVTESIEIPMGVYWARALRLTFAGLCPVHAWWERSLEAVRSGAIDPIPIISHRLPLSRAPEGYALFDARRATKVVLYP